jgi:phage shock protein A
MGIWARLAEAVAAHLLFPAGREETPQQRCARAVRELEEALTLARKYVAVAAACARRLERERDRQRERVAFWERQARAARGDELAGHFLNIHREHEELLSDLQTHCDAARRDYADARLALDALEVRLTEARLVRRVLWEREEKRSAGSSPAG